MVKEVKKAESFTAYGLLTTVSVWVSLALGIIETELDDGSNDGDFPRDIN